MNGVRHVYWRDGEFWLGYLLRRFVLLPIIALSTATAGVQSLDVAFQPIKEAFIEGEPVILRMVITNPSDTACTVDLGWDREGLLFFGSAFLEMKTNALPLLGGGIRAGKVTVSPNGSYRQHVVLDQWLTVQVGEYALIGQLGDPAITVSEFRFKVLPYDAKQFEQSILDLLEAAQKRGGALIISDPSVRALRAIYRRSERGREMLIKNTSVAPGLRQFLERDPAY